jgi:hypothetical protein
MKFRNLIALLAALAIGAASFLPVERAEAAANYMCQGDVSGASTGSRTIGGSLSAVPSGALYTLNSQGCALIQLADVGYFSSQGYVANSSQNTILFNTGVAAGTTNFVIGTLPAKAYIQQVIFSNSVAATAGTISIGSTASGTQIVTGLAVGASTDIAATIALPVSATGVATSLNMSSTAWNSSNVTVTVIYGFY